MGMFDTIQWNGYLPFSEEMKSLGLDKTEWSFQTKDFDCYMEDYVVQNGQLFLKKYEKVTHIEGDPDAENWIDSFGHTEKIGPYLEAVKIDHTIHMYDHRRDVMGVWDCSIEFKVKFIDGKIESLELFLFEKNSNEVRKQTELRFEEYHRYVHSLWYNRFIFHTSPYRWVRRKSSRFLYRIGTFIHNLSHKLP